MVIGGLTQWLQIGIYYNFICYTIERWEMIIILRVKGEDFKKWVFYNSHEGKSADANEISSINFKCLAFQLERFYYLG